MSIIIINSRNPALKSISVFSAKNLTVNDASGVIILSAAAEDNIWCAGVPTKHATYQIVLPIIYLHCFKGNFMVRVGLL